MKMWQNDFFSYYCPALTALYRSSRMVAISEVARSQQYAVQPALDWMTPITPQVHWAFFLCTSSRRGLSFVTHIRRHLSIRLCSSVSRPYTSHLLIRPYFTSFCPMQRNLCFQIQGSLLNSPDSICPQFAQPTPALVLRPSSDPTDESTKLPETSNSTNHSSTILVIIKHANHVQFGIRDYQTIPKKKQTKNPQSGKSMRLIQ